MTIATEYSHTPERLLWRRIPKNWKLLPLKYLCSQSAIYGANISSEAYVQEGIRFLRTTDIRDDSSLANEGVYLSKESAKDYGSIPLFISFM